MSEKKIHDPIRFLQEEWDQRKARNPYFSLRSFARHMDISAAQLSQILSGKRPLTEKMVDKISEKLHLSPHDRIDFQKAAMGPDYKNKLSTSNNDYINLAQEEFRLISDWYHLPILSLAELVEVQSDPMWISKKLMIPYDQAKVAFNRLKKLQIIEADRKKFWQVKRPLSITTDVASSAIQHYHRQNLDLAKEKLITVDLDKREFSSVTVATNPENILKAKKMITDFKRKLAATLAQGEKSEVYTLSIQLFPNTL